MSVSVVALWLLVTIFHYLLSLLVYYSQICFSCSNIRVPSVSLRHTGKCLFQTAPITEKHSQGKVPWMQHLLSTTTTIVAEALIHILMADEVSD